MTPEGDRAGVAGLLRGRLAYVALALALVLLDQASKLAVVARFDVGESLVVIPGFFEISHVRNPGGVWGIGRMVSSGVRAVVFVALPLAITLLACWYSLQLRSTDRIRQGAVALVVGGALGNLIDRIRLGHVVDFLEFHLGDAYWPTFNVADSAICVGVAVLLLSTFLPSDEDAEGRGDA